MRFRGVALLVWSVGVCGATAQGPSAPWRTVSTEHFRVHFVAPEQAWAMRVAARLETIRARVSADVGYAPPQVVDVIVSDPLAQPNGAAIPLLGAPRLILWTTPPGPDSLLGSYRDWGELVALHEESHLAHLLRPTRSPMRRLLEALLPLGPIVLKAPRWVIEGYATQLEGELTGSGRPNGDLRAAILRRWAIAGRLPSYGRLASDRRDWLGMSMAYLVGSAYLEWLVERAGPDSLPHLWRRLTARRDRGFDEAFEGVFGDRPETLYARFTAELTYRAMEVERLVKPAEREGRLWQELRWTTGAPALSPDGSMLAIVLRGRERPARLVVWSTAPDERAAKGERERVERMLRRDAEDVAPVRTRPEARGPLFELRPGDGAELDSPRWLPDGLGILFVGYEPDLRGFVHPDLFVWRPRSGEVRRLTRQADLRDADPAPDGVWAVAVRTRDGLSQLVRVDLADGAVTAVTAPSLEEVVATPRVSPDGARIAYLRHSGGGWRLVVRRLADGGESEIAAPVGSTVGHPAWTAGGQAILVDLGEGGFIDLFELATGAHVAPLRLTRTLGAALAPAATPDGRTVYFLSLEPDGFSLRVVETGPAPAARSAGALDEDLAPAVRPAPPATLPALAAVPPGPPHDYRLGRQELGVLVGGGVSPSGRSLEAGARVGDVVGRLDVLAVASESSAGPRGATLAAAWRGWPVTLTAQAFDVRERPSAQPGRVPGLGDELDATWRGLIVQAGWRGAWPGLTAELGAGGVAGSLEPRGGAALDRRSGFVSGDMTHAATLDRWRLWQRLRARLDAGRTGGDPWRVRAGRLTLGVSHGEDSLALSWERGEESGARRGLDRMVLGGTASTLLPEAALPARVLSPALPLGIAVGDQHEGERAELDLAALPLGLFYERHRVWSHDASRGGWLRLAGLDLRLASDPLPLVRLPGIELHLGAARVLDAPLEGATQWWLGLTYRP